MKISGFVIRIPYQSLLLAVAIAQHYVPTIISKRRID
jgi:hypothetical protein